MWRKTPTLPTSNYMSGKLFLKIEIISSPLSVSGIWEYKILFLWSGCTICHSWSECNYPNHVNSLKAQTLLLVVAKGTSEIQNMREIWSKCITRYIVKTFQLLLPQMHYYNVLLSRAAAAAAAKSLQSCRTLCDPRDGSPPGSPVPWDSPGKNTGVGCHFFLLCMKVKSESEVTQSCPTLRDLMDCSPPGSFVQGIFQARVLEWVAIAFSAPELTTGINLIFF